MKISFSTFLCGLLFYHSLTNDVPIWLRIVIGLFFILFVISDIWIYSTEKDEIESIKSKQASILDYGKRVVKLNDEIIECSKNISDDNKKIIDECKKLRDSTIGLSKESQMVLDIFKSAIDESKSYKKGS